MGKLGREFKVDGSDDDNVCAGTDVGTWFRRNTAGVLELGMAANRELLLEQSTKGETSMLQHLNSILPINGT